MKENRKILLLSGLSVILISMCIWSLYKYNHIEFIFDSADYWWRGSMLFGDKPSLLNIDGFRGYAFPLFLGGMQLLPKSNDWWCAINGLVIGVFFIAVLPALHEKKLDLAAIIGGGCSFLIFSVFYWGTEVYPLSDMPALIVISIAIMLRNRLQKINSIGGKISLSVFVGTLLYLTYNIRTIYMFSILVLLIECIWEGIVVHDKLIRKITEIIGIIVGIVIGAIPQIYMNINQLGKWSIMVPTNGLMLDQLLWGIEYQRYDTYAGSIEQSIPQIYIEDSVGMKLLAADNITRFTSYGEMLKFVLRHLFECIGIYVRHFVNILFPCWPRQYVFMLNNNKTVYVFLATTTIFLFLLCTINRQLSTHRHVKNYIVILTPAICILPGAVEVRFFIGLWIFMIGTLCFNVKWRDTVNYIKCNKIKVGIEYLGTLLIFISMWSGMLGSVQTANVFIR